MVEQLFPTYTLRIKVLSPVHIGSGERMQQIQWKLENGRLYVLDLESWVQSVVESGDLKKASSWTTALEKGRLPQEYAEDWKNWALYDIPCTWRGVEATEILPFIQQGGLGTFFPGSSLKGSLRSALLRGIASLDPNGLKTISGWLDKELELQKPRTHSQEFEAQYFSNNDPRSSKWPNYDPRSSKWPNYDINRLWMVRDQKLPFDALEAVRVQIFSVSTKTTLIPKPASIFLEVLKPGYEFSTRMVWQSHLTDNEAESTLGFQKKVQYWLYLAHYCREAALRLIEQEYHFYDRHIETRVADWYQQLYQTALDLPENAFLLPIGYGSGFDAKTITRMLGKARFEQVCQTFRKTHGLGRPGNTLDGQWQGPDDAPKSRKLVLREDEQKLPLGWIEVRMQPADEQADWLQTLQAKFENKPNFPAHRPLGRSAPASSPASSSVTKPVETPRKREEPPRPTLIPEFSELPKPGDRFHGVILDQDEKGVWLEIPGLSADDQAMAFIPSAELGDKKLSGRNKVLCRVVDVKPDLKQKNFFLVHCALE